MSEVFTKPALSHKEQVQLLRSRGMVVENLDEAEHFLANINYYRLAAYWLPFEKDHATHKFIEGTTFLKVLNLYIFDRELRLLLLDAIERIEVAIRARWAYELAHAFGPHAHLNRSIVRDGENLNKDEGQLLTELLRSQEQFIRHLRKKYAERTPPIWATCEVMSLGLLSRYYGNLRPRAVRRRIAEPFDLNHGQLQSWLHHLAIVRNGCAHHARLWNREFTITPEPPKSRPSRLSNRWAPDSRKIFNTLLIVLHFMDVVAPDHSLRKRLIGLLQRHELPGGLQAMGFLPNSTTDELHRV